MSIHDEGAGACQGEHERLSDSDPSATTGKVVSCPRCHGRAALSPARSVVHHEHVRVSEREVLDVFTYEALARPEPEGFAAPRSMVTRPWSDGATYYSYDPSFGQVTEKTLFAPELPRRTDASPGPVRRFDPSCLPHLEAAALGLSRRLGELGTDLDVHALEDVAQDAALLLLTREDLTVHHPHAYALRVGRQLMHAELARRERHPGLGLERLLEETVVLEPSSPEPSADAGLLREELMHDASDLLRRLTPCLLEALILVRAHGLSSSEAARLLGSSPAAVRKALERALRTLDAALERGT